MKAQLNQFDLASRDMNMCIQVLEEENEFLQEQIRSLLQLDEDESVYNQHANNEELEQQIEALKAQLEEVTRDNSTGNAGQKVEIYTTKRCAYCKKAKAFFASHRIPFTEYDVEHSGKGRRDYKKLDGQGVPIIMVGNRRLNGFSETYLAAVLKKAGYPL